MVNEDIFGANFKQNVWWNLVVEPILVIRFIELKKTKDNNKLITVEGIKKGIKQQKRAI